ncbi:hypothetical protein PV04_06691 [Phialophora macrospora]|uniref:Uncharacterized protein n=1 Tax=Phialophora macrospora TaxID=1851006 RepID=A0A0D2FL32_9EURO|nr:hypothetical protein PV04_06691 [Phialophora macrospora]
MRRPQSSTGVRSWSASAGIDLTRMVRNHVSSLAAQRYEIKDDLGNRARPPRRHTLIGHDLTGSQSDDFAKPLLSIHEFLGIPAHVKPRGQDTMGDLGALRTGQGPASTLRSVSSCPRVARVLQQLPISPTGLSLRRDHISFIDTSDDEDCHNRRNQDHLEPFADAKSIPCLTSQTSAFGHTILGPTNKEPPETNEMQPPVLDWATRDRGGKVSPKSSRQYDGSDDPIEGPMLSFEALHRSLSRDELNAHEVTTPANPNFSHFLDYEEPGDTMNGLLSDVYVNEQYHRATDNDMLSNEVRPKVSPSISPQSIRNDIGRRSWPSTPIRSRTASVRSGAHNGTNRVECGECLAGGLIPLSLASSSACMRQAPEKHVRKVNSEEEMRMRTLTAIQSPAAFRARNISSSRPATPTGIAIPNIGVPSIVRSPQHKKQKQVLYNLSSPKQQKTSPPRQKQGPVKASRKWSRDSRAASVSNSMIPGRDVTVVGTGIDSEDEGSEIWTFPTTPVSQRNTTSIGVVPTPFYADFPSGLGSRSGSSTPRRQTTSWRAQPASACKSLVTAFDGISSEHSLEWEPDLAISNADLDGLVWLAGEGYEDRDEQGEEGVEEDQSEPDSDLDAALPPPDISRHPPDRGSPRSTGKETRRLSSLTSVSWKTKTKLKRKPKAEMEPQSQSGPAPMSMADHLTDTVLRPLDQCSRSGFETGRQRAHAAGPGAGVDTGPGRTTSLIRLEAIMEQAEEEAGADRKKGVRRLWQRLKRRIES